MHSFLYRHNDLAWQIRAQFQNQLDKVDLTKNGSGADPKVYGHEWQTDIPRLRAGMVGGQVSPHTSPIHSAYQQRTYKLIWSEIYLCPPPLPPISKMFLRPRTVYTLLLHSVVLLIPAVLVSLHALQYTV